MSIMLETPNELEVRRRDLQSIGAAVRAMLASQVMRLQVERRREQRFPFPYPIRLTPVSPDGTVSAADSVFVLGKHLSEHGVDFYYTDPLPYRRVVVAFERGGREVLEMLMELTWCRFGRHGWYENGGRFLEVLRSERVGIG
jgi:hypothetical protein